MTTTHYRIVYPDLPIVTLHSIDLQKAGALERLILAGFTHIRQVFPKFRKVLREPTIGCIVEISTRVDAGSIPIDSAKAQRLIWRQTYF